MVDPKYTDSARRRTAEGKSTTRYGILLVPLLALAAFVATACGSGGQRAQDTPVDGAETGGIDGFRAFAARIADALTASDASFFSHRVVVDEITCVGDESVAPCAGQPAGTILRGVFSALSGTDASSFFESDEYEALLQEWFASDRPDLSDELGSGILTLYALAYMNTAQPIYLGILTGIFEAGTAGDARQEARVLHFQFVEGNWRLVREWFDRSFSADQFAEDCSP